MTAVVFESFDEFWRLSKPANVMEVRDGAIAAAVAASSAVRSCRSRDALSQFSAIFARFQAFLRKNTVSGLLPSTVVV